MDDIIKIKELNVSYGNNEIIKDIDLNIKKNCLTVIVGKNGSGKTTLLKAIGGINKGYKGEIIINEVNLSNIPGNEKAKTVSYLAQNKPVSGLPVKTYVLHGRFPYLSYPRKYTKQDWKLVKEAIDELSIGHIKHKRLNEISGGERQKAYLAMTVVQDTDIILLDEPLSFLDKSTQFEILKLIKAFSERGKTVVMVSHDLQDILYYADEIVVLDKGKVIDKGTREDIIENETLQKVFDINVIHHGDNYYITEKTTN